MGELASAAESRRILQALLDGAELDDEEWLGRVRKVRSLSGKPVFAELIVALTHVRLEEGEAEALWPRLLAHRREMSARLDRDVGVRLAVFDWFINVDPRLNDPKLLEFGQFEMTERAALTDWLTGLFNRAAFRASSVREIRRAQRYRQGLAVMLLDLDDFKNINDRFGHETGDRVLKETGQLIRACVRDVDIAARYGGEEFAVLLPETAREGGAMVAERIREAMIAKRSVQGPRQEPVHLTISGGVAVYPDDGEDLPDLLQHADAALYRAKALGKNRILTDFQDKRASSRIRISNPIADVALCRAGDDEPLAGGVRDISRSGFGFSSPRRPRVGERIELRFGREPGKVTRFGGNVIWSRELPDTAEGVTHAAGVRFDEGSRASAGQHLEAMLSREHDSPEIS